MRNCKASDSDACSFAVPVQSNDTEAQQLREHNNSSNVDKVRLPIRLCG